MLNSWSTKILKVWLFRSRLKITNHEQLKKKSAIATGVYKPLCFTLAGWPRKWSETFSIWLEYLLLATIKWQLALNSLVLPLQRCGQNLWKCFLLKDWWSWFGQIKRKVQIISYISILMPCIEPTKLCSVFTSYWKWVTLWIIRLHLIKLNNFFDNRLFP